MRSLALALVALSLTVATAPAQAARAGDLTLKAPVLRASLGQVPTSAGYLTIVNAGVKPDRLVSVSCACAKAVLIHRSEMKGGMASMSDAGALTIPAKSEVVFKPGSLHLMLVGVKAALKDGATQDMVLVFERAGPLKAGFAVRSRIDAGDDMAAMPGMKGMGDMPGMKP